MCVCVCAYKKEYMSSHPISVTLRRKIKIEEKWNEQLVLSGMGFTWQKQIKMGY